jgi:hypothetical protein
MGNIVYTFPILINIYLLIYILFISFSYNRGELPKKTMLTQLIFSLSYLSVSLLRSIGDLDLYVVAIETAMFSIIIILNSEMFKMSFKNSIDRAREFTSFIKTIGPSFEDLSEITSAYFSNYPNIHMVKISTKRIVFASELIGFIVLIISIICFFM